MDIILKLANDAGIETDRTPGGQLVRRSDVGPFLKAVASAGLGIVGFDVFRSGPRGFELDPGGTASFGNASAVDNNVELSRTILSAYCEEPDVWVDFTLSET